MAYVINGNVLKGGTVFDFKHVPQEGKQLTTEKCIASEQESRQDATSKPHPVDRWLERILPGTFLLGSSVLLMTLFVLTTVLWLSFSKLMAMS